MKVVSIDAVSLACCRHRTFNKSCSFWEESVQLDYMPSIFVRQLDYGWADSVFGLCCLILIPFSNVWLRAWFIYSACLLSSCCSVEHCGEIWGISEQKRHTSHITELAAGREIDLFIRGLHGDHSISRGAGFVMWPFSCSTGDPDVCEL